MARENLEDVYNTLVAADFDFTTLPATNKFRVYYEYKTDPTKRALPAGSAQSTGTKAKVGVRPFGFAFDVSKFEVKMSGRGFTIVNNDTDRTLYNLVTDAAALDDYTSRTGFIPAKAHIAVRLQTPTAVIATANRVSGRAYRKRVGESYAIPYGRSAATDEEIVIQEEILDAKSATHTVTFTPERLRRR
jgi:hypothetical protein